MVPRPQGVAQEKSECREGLALTSPMLTWKPGGPRREANRQQAIPLTHGLPSRAATTAPLLPWQLFSGFSSFPSTEPQEQGPGGQAGHKGGLGDRGISG